MGRVCLAPVHQWPGCQRAGIKDVECRVTGGISVRVETNMSAPTQYANAGTAFKRKCASDASHKYMS